jgi:hypothetical protein
MKEMKAQVECFTWRRNKVTFIAEKIGFCVLHNGIKIWCRNSNYSIQYNHILSLCVLIPLGASHLPYSQAVALAALSTYLHQLQVNTAR